MVFANEDLRPSTCRHRAPQPVVCGRACWCKCKYTLYVVEMKRKRGSGEGGRARQGYTDVRAGQAPSRSSHFESARPIRPPGAATCARRPHGAWLHVTWHMAAWRMAAWRMAHGRMAHGRMAHGTWPHGGVIIVFMPVCHAKNGLVLHVRSCFAHLCTVSPHG
eukprot:365637-Chlamydomonas_euryale.AAC.1